MEKKNAPEDLLRLCRLVCDKGFVASSGGNISARCGGDILITPTGRNLGLLEEKDIVRMRPDGEVLGGGSPSKEWRMHCGCYARKDARFIVHLHSPYATALACLDRDNACAMPVYTPGYAVRVGKLPVVPYYRPGSPELADHVAAHIGTRKSVLLANHGLLTVGATAEEALNIAEEVEENARLFFLLSGKGISLTEAQQGDLAGKY